jgi:hypothetical protein
MEKLVQDTYLKFQTAYLERVKECYGDFLDAVPSASHIKKDACALYVAWLSGWCMAQDLDGKQKQTRWYLGTVSIR